MILSTEDHHKLMQNVAEKCSAKCSLLPSVCSSSGEVAENNTFQEKLGNSFERGGLLSDKLWVLNVHYKSYYN